MKTPFTFSIQPLTWRVTQTGPFTKGQYMDYSWPNDPQNFTEEQQQASEPTDREMNLLKQRDDALRKLAAMPARAMLVEFFLTLGKKSTDVCVSLNKPETFYQKMAAGDIRSDCSRMLCYLQTGHDIRHEWPDMKV